MRVRLYRRSQGIWWASWTAGGITVRHSTRATSEAEARAVVATWPHLASAKSFKFDEVGVVYFAEAVGLGRVKIGWTREDKLEGRIATLQTGCPAPLRVAATFTGRMLEEYREHARFTDARIHGEWFVATPSLLARIEELREPRVLQTTPVQGTSGRTRRTKKPCKPRKK